MRIRTIKPEFWQNEELAELSVESNLLAIGLLNYADDEGYFKLNPKLIESTIFPLRKLSVTIHAMLSELSSIGYISTHEGSDGKKYGLVINFLKHQRVNRPNPSKIAPIICGTIEIDSSVRTHIQLTEDSPTEGNRKGIGKEEEGNGDIEPDGSCPTKPDELTEPMLSLWKEAPEKSRRRSSQVKVNRAWKAINVSERPSRDELLHAIGCWNKSEDWKKDGGQFAMALDRWIRERQWQNCPDFEITPQNLTPDIGGRTMASTKVSEINYDQIKHEEYDDIPI